MTWVSMPSRAHITHNAMRRPLCPTQKVETCVHGSQTMVKYDHNPMNIVANNQITPIDRTGEVGRSNSIALFHNLV